MARSRFYITIVGAALLASCGGSSGGAGPTASPTAPTGGGTNPPATPTAANQVVLSGSAFQPSSIAISKGTTVTWTWNDCSDGGYGGYSTCVSHSVDFDDGTSSPTQSSGTFTRTFNAAGTFKYHCAVHGQAMSGQVTVQ
jgi:plastocyanin